MKMKKAIAAVLTLAISGTLFTGCAVTSDSASTTSGTASGTVSTAASATSAATSAAASTGDTAGKTVIEFFNQKTEIVDILQNLISEYEKENPTISIELTTPTDATTVLTSRMASDDTPDIFTQWPSSTFFSEVDSGYVMDLTDTGIMDNVSDVAKNQWKHNGKDYAAEISYNCSGIWYNKDLFTKAGITTLPTTWDELMKDCETFKAAGITPFEVSAKETSITDRQLQVFLASCMGDNYQTFEDAASGKTMDSKASYASSLQSMASKMLQMISYAQSDVAGTDQDSATADFASGKAAMMIGGSWLLASVTSANPDINMAMMPIPGDTAADTNTCAYPGDMTLCIAAKSDVQKEAVAFVKWMTDKTQATEYAKAEGNPSCINGVDYVADQFKDLYDNYVTTGKFILNPDCTWSSAQQGAAGAAVQQLYYDQDANAFAENLTSAFNDN
ncbi:MAG TPA: extracellular solute-binding protein [Lachnospiraceae bacterium]|nr:extracellular solute-binding protein [Lachnospiraceae bacterium]